MQAQIPNTRWLDELARAVPIARQGDDPEGVHQVRVAAGRLDTWLRMAGLRILRDDLRWLRGHASAVRDLDVVLQEALPDALAHWLREQRQDERRRLVSALDHPRLEALLAALRWLAPLPRRAALAYQSRQRAAVLQAGQRLRSTRATVADLHRLRRAVRRLRYALEWTASPARAVHTLQDALGAFNDTAVAVRLLDEFPDRKVIAAPRRRLAEHLAAQRKSALTAWHTAAPRLRRKAAP